jgi:divalent metal cation (Fe/Co/Zn/Cd) transporter
VLLNGFEGNLPNLNMSTLTISILLLAIIVKLVLWFYCSMIGKISSSAAALAQDHRNDVLSNTVAVATSLWAHHMPVFWYVDGVGAILISMYITASWLATGKEQVERLVGLRKFLSIFMNAL